MCFRSASSFDVAIVFRSSAPSTVVYDAAVSSSKDSASSVWPEVSRAEAALIDAEVDKHSVIDIVEKHVNKRFPRGILQNESIQ